MKKNTLFSVFSHSKKMVTLALAGALTCFLLAAAAAKATLQVTATTPQQQTPSKAGPPHPRL